MKRIIVFSCWIVTFFFSVLPADGAIVTPGYEGGVQNEQTYEEVVFITGKPLVFTGTVKINTQGDRISYSLGNSEVGGLLSRSITLDKTVEEKEGQTISITELKRYTEKIKIGNDTYQVKDVEVYPFHQSIVTDHKPAVDYYAGNWAGLKTYTINKDEGTVSVKVTGENVGYDHFWGSTETQIIKQVIDSKRTQVVQRTDNNGNTQDVSQTVSWMGTVDLNVSYNQTRKLNYIDNEPTQISFRGGYLETTQGENVMQYSYSLPSFTEQTTANGETESVVDEKHRNRGSSELKLQTVPTQRRLSVVHYRDVDGHWGKEDIEQLASMDVFTQKEGFFGPDLPMTRAEFAKAIALAANMVTEEPENIKASRFSRNKNEETAEEIFVDVVSTDPYYQYIKEVEKRGVIKGINEKQFSPQGELTRAQAITIIIRALGFENLAPNPGYQTGFIDDYAIPYWANDSIYLANEMGLVQGDEYGYVMPNQYMTRAEAAAFLNRFIRYLQDELRTDYRERIIYFQ